MWKPPTLVYYKYSWKLTYFEIAGNKSAGKVDIVQLCTTRPPSTGFVISTFRLLSELHAQQGLHGGWINVKAPTAAQLLVYTQVHNEKFAKLKLIILTNQQHTFQTLSLIHKLESNHISATICHLYNLATSSYNEKHTVLYYAYMTLAHIFHIATQSIIN